MSHTVTLEYKLTDKSAIIGACGKLGLTVKERARGTGSLSRETGLGIRLPGWTHDVIINEAGDVKYDNWNGNWGKKEELDKLVSQYNFDVVTSALENEGFEYVVDESEDKIEILTI